MVKRRKGIEVEEMIYDVQTNGPNRASFTDHVVVRTESALKISQHFSVHVTKSGQLFVPCGGRLLSHHL